MKIFLILLTVLTAPLLTAQEKELFQVSKVGGDKSKLIEIFQRVQLMEAGNGADIAAYHVLKRIDARRFLVHSIKKGQDPFSAKSKPDLTKTYLLVTAQDKATAEGGRILVPKPKPTEETHSYVDQYGAKLSAPILKVEVVEGEDALLTQAQFIKALKSGDSWTLEDYARKKCFECFGKGNSGPLQGNVKCGACNGEGTVFVDCVVEW